MIVFSREKCRKIFDLHSDGFVEFFRAIERGDKIRSNLFFILVLGVDSGRIVISSIGELAISLGRIYLGEVELDEFFVRYQARIVDDFYSFTMFRKSSPDFLIARICLTASCVSGDCFAHSYLRFKYPLHTPEASSGKIGTSS